MYPNVADNSRRLNFQFSTVNVLLVMSLLAVTIAWLIDRQRFLRRETSIRKSLARWANAETDARTELAWNSLKHLDPESKVIEFDKRMHGRLFWMIDEAYLLENSLDEAFDRIGFTSEQAGEMISRWSDDSMNSPAKIENRMMQFYELGGVRSRELFPHLFDTESDEYLKFRSFLRRVFEQVQKSDH